MLEFTMSRVALFVCGAILLGAVAIPISDTYDDRSERDLRDVVDKTAIIMDTFGRSDIDTMTLRGWDILPTPGCVLELDGHNVTLYKDGKSYRGLMSHESEHVSMSYNQMLTVEKEDGKLTCAISG